MNESFSDLLEKFSTLYREHLPEQYEEITPATRKEIEDFEKLVGRPLPGELKLLFMNGRERIHNTEGYNSLSLSESRDEWLMNKKLLEEGKFKNRDIASNEGIAAGIIQNTYWSPYWIPVFADSGGNLLCVDLDPGPAGKVGQIMAMEFQDGQGPFKTPHDSVMDYLSWLWSELDKRGLTRRKPDPEASSPAGLASAIFDKDLEAVRAILKPGVKATGQGSDGKSDLMYATMYGGEEIALLVLAAGPTMANVPDFEKYYPITFATEQSALLKALIENGADINVRWDRGSTPLISAADKGHLESVKILVQAGADISAKTEYGMDALDFARRKGHTEIVDYLEASISDSQIRQ